MEDQNFIGKSKARIVALEAERNQIQKTFKEISDTNDELDAENDRLRQALQDAPHDYNCDALPRYSEILGIPPGPIVTELPPRGSCTCWKAALACTPEAKL